MSVVHVPGNGEYQIPRGRATTFSFHRIHFIMRGHTYVCVAVLMFVRGVSTEARDRCLIPQLEVQEFGSWLPYVGDGI